MNAYTISLEAKYDLDQIWQYTLDQWSLNQADRYINLIIDKIEYVSKHPERGRDMSNIRVGYRKAMVKSHIIFYKENKEEGVIEIIRVLHQKRDIKSIMSS